MVCGACNFENRDDARFCGECGGSLAAEIVCESCRRASPAGRRFCDGCGRPLGATMAPAASPRTYTPRHLAERILTARSALEGERKQVTVLFADVQRSMELAEQVDAEEWHRILDRFFQILSEGVHRFEGTINQYTGDGVMALFGAPLAHEDHAQRACHAALHLRQALQRFGDDLRVSHGLNFSVRMGLNSGEVVVGKIGDDLRMDYTAQGPTVGLAARMEQLAEAGKVLLTENTARLASGYFALRDLGPARIKGVAEPMPIYELEGVGELLTRFDVSRARGFSKFVGRAAEMQTLETALERALAGAGSVVGIVAEAGTGKSRLCHELVQRCRARGIAVYEGHALSHAKMVPLLPLLELLRGIFGVAAHDPPETARQKIAGTIVLLDAELQSSLPLWFDFLGVPDPARALHATEPEARQQQLVHATHRLLQARGRSGPSVLLIEDLHWLDEASEALLASLVELAPGSRTQLLLNFRPEYRAAWMEREAVPYTEIALRPLGDEAIDALLDELVGRGEGLDELRRQVRERTGGSPFFVEEVVRSLFDQGILVRSANGAMLARQVARIEIPATVQAVLAARIDRLAEPIKHVLQTAAVIGQSFHESVLRDVLGSDATPLPAALDALVADGFVAQEEAYPTPRYGFRHPLTQEVAYRSQLGEHRARVHAAVARAIEAASANSSIDEQAALLAHHYAGAGENLRAAEWHRRAAEWIGMRDRRAMMRHWEQLCELLSTAPPSPEADALGVAARQRMMMSGIFIGMSRDEIQKLFDEGIELASRLPTVVPNLMLRVSFGVSRLFCGEPAESVAQLLEALRIADETGDRTLRYVTRVSLVAPMIHAGRLREALATNLAAETFSGGDTDLGSEYTRLSPYGIMLAQRSQALINLGRPLEVDAPLTRVLELGHERSDPELVEMGHVFFAHAADLLGDGDAASLHARQAIDVAEKVDSAQLRVGAYGALGCAYLLQERYAEAEEALNVSLDVMRTGHTGLFLEPIRLTDRAETRLLRDDLDGARADIERAESVARSRGSRLALVRALSVRAHLDRLSGVAPDAIEARLDEADALAATTGGLAWLPLVHLQRAAVAAQRGDAEGRAAFLAKAKQAYLEMGAAARAARID